MISFLSENAVLPLCKTQSARSSLFGSAFCEEEGGNHFLAARGVYSKVITGNLGALKKHLYFDHDPMLTPPLQWTKRRSRLSLRVLAWFAAERLRVCCFKWQCLASCRVVGSCTTPRSSFARMTSFTSKGSGTVILRSSPL